MVQSLLGAVGYACEVKESQLDGERRRWWGRGGGGDVLFGGDFLCDC